MLYETVCESMRKCVHN